MYKIYTYIYISISIHIHIWYVTQQNAFITVTTELPAQ